MKNLDIKLENSPLIYRSKLTIPSHINFGLELELDKVDYDEVRELVRREVNGSFIVKTDDSLTKGQSAEIVTPVLRNNKETWILLKKLGELLQRLNPDYSLCSFQVNFDGSLLPWNEDKVRFLKLFAMYEDIIYRFSLGEDEEFRESIETYAYPIIWMMKSIKSHGNDSIVDMFSKNKRYGIVFKENPDLIEFRSPNMSSNPIMWQNYITTFYYLIEASISKKLDMKKVDYYIDHFYKSYILENYSLEKKDKAIEFCDLIFKKSDDSISFMHQYLKK